MNDKQKKVLMAVAAVILAMLIYPPYTEPVRFDSTHVVPGYAFISDLPFMATINAPTLLIQWLGVAIIGGIAFFLVKDDRGS